MDLGSQTFRMVGVELGADRAKILFSKRANVRMGQSLLEQGVFSQEAMDRGLRALSDFTRDLSRCGVEATRTVATEAFRRSGNSSDFLKEAKKFGVEIEIISSEEEAALAVKGTYLTVPHSDSPWIMVDSGGGSTEIALCVRDKIKRWVSLDLGAVTLKESSYPFDSSNSKEFLREMARKRLTQGLKGFKKLLDVGTIVATGGTATTIAAVVLGLSSYDPKKVRGFTVSCQGLEKLYSEISDMDLKARKTVKGLEPERADIFPAGIAILLELIRYLGLKKLIISDGGILLGLLTAFMEKECDFYVELSCARGLYV